MKNSILHFEAHLKIWTPTCCFLSKETRKHQGATGSVSRSRGKGASRRQVLEAGPQQPQITGRLSSSCCNEETSGGEHAPSCGRKKDC
ncbi:Netrin Receptor Dcc [Manis pentadactyla]|nr:Netrin Receptor Dcc [Manis pentadactyla]